MQPKQSMLTVDRNIRLQAIRAPGKLALVDGARSLTYSALDGRIDRVVGLLDGLGLVKGDRLAVLLKNRLEWAEILFACARSGVICVPVNHRFVASEIAFVIEHSGAKALISETRLVDRVNALRSANVLPLVESWLAVGDDATPQWRPYESLLAAATPHAGRADVDDTDCWYLGYTSGTTGKPKAVILNHRAKTLGVLYAGLEYQISDVDSTLLVMPLFHSNGIFFQLLLLSLGGTVVIIEDFDAEQALRLIAEERITVVSLVPTMYALMLALPDAVKARYDMQSLRVVISSSAPLMAQTKERMLQFFPGASIHEFYGSTEAGFVTNLKPRDQMRKLQSVGQPFLGTEVMLLNTEGEEVAQGEVGELWSRGVTQSYDGYLGEPELSAKAYRPGGWFSAGDLARQDEEGYLYIVDRKKDLIISGGENVYPTEVENVLVRHEAIEEVAVVGMPDPTWGDRVCAVIRFKPGMALTLEELRQWSKSRMADYKCPRQLVVCDALPKSPTGKLLRRAVREQVSAKASG
jgi:long-chain acyl-CoA synthetase